MVFNGKTGRTKPRGLVAVLAIVLIPLFSLSAQDKAQDKSQDKANDKTEKISVEISPDKILVNQRFDFVILADFDSYRNVSIKEPRLPEGISLAGGPYRSAQTVRVGDLSEPKYVKRTRIIYKFKVSAPGIYTIGSFTLGEDLATLSTKPVTFPVLAYDERELNYPIFARWGSIPDKIYVGETIPLVLKMENLEALSFPESVSMNPPSGGMFERVNSLGEIKTTHIGDTEVYIAPIDSWLYTPTAPGRIRIPEASVKMDGVVRSSPTVYIDVVPVPDDIQASGAIGSFSVTSTTEGLPPDKNRTGTLRVRVSGEGNLGYLRMPQPVISGLTVIDKEEVNSYVPSNSGFKGYREDLYKIGPGQDKDMVISFPRWSWYDQKSDSVKSTQLDEIRYKNTNLGGDKDLSSHREQFDLLPTDVIMKQRGSLYDKGIYYLLLLPGLVSIIAALIRRKIDYRISAFSLLLLLVTSSSIAMIESPEKDLNTARSLYDSGDRKAALELYNSLDKQLGNNPAYLYNRSLMNYDLDKRSGAVYDLRKALSFKPGNKLYMKALRMMEQDYGLDHQLRPGTGLSPDLFFLFFLLLFNGGAMTISLNIRKRRMELSIAIIMIFFLSVISLGIVFYSDYFRHIETAVVAGPQGDLKKVPGSMGSEWMTLQEGTAVRIISETGDSCLIRTGYGLEGWLNKGQLLFLNGGE